MGAGSSDDAEGGAASGGGGRRERTDHVGCERREARSGLGASAACDGCGVRDGRARLAGIVDWWAVCCLDARIVRRRARLQWLQIVEFMAFGWSWSGNFGQRKERDCCRLRLRLTTEAIVIRQDAISAEWYRVKLLKLSYFAYGVNYLSLVAIKLITSQLVAIKLPLQLPVTSCL